MRLGFSGKNPQSLAELKLLYAIHLQLPLLYMEDVNCVHRHSGIIIWSIA